MLNNRKPRSLHRGGQEGWAEGQERRRREDYNRGSWLHCLLSIISTIEGEEGRETVKREGVNRKERTRGRPKKKSRPGTERRLTYISLQFKRRHVPQH